MEHDEQDDLGVLLSRAEQQSFLQAARQGDRGAILQILDRAADVYVEDENHYTPLMHAAAGGHMEIVRMLLPTCVAHDEAVWLVQQAFEVAVEAGHPKIARLLIDIGADPDWAFVGMQDYWERCPICLSRCCPGAKRVCKHWICSSDAMGFTWFLSETENFELQVEELVSLAHQLFARPDAATLLAGCPLRFREVLMQIRQHGRYYWALDDRVQINRWETKGPISDCGLHFYAKTPRIGVRVREKALAIIQWLRCHRL